MGVLDTPTQRMVEYWNAEIWVGGLIPGSSPGTPMEKLALLRRFQLDVFGIRTLLALLTFGEV